jgi:hypothetical protein
MHQPPPRLSRCRWATAFLLTLAVLATLPACLSSGGSAVENSAAVPSWRYICYDGAERPIAEALDAGAGQIHAAYRLEVDQTFARWFPDRPDLSTITTIRPYEPLFILTSATIAWETDRSAPPSTVSLVPGWNAVCYGGSTRSAAEATASIGEQLAVLYSLASDSAWQRFAPGRPDVSNLAELNTLDPILLLTTGATDIVWAFSQEGSFTWPDWARQARIAGAFFEPDDSDDDIQGTLDDLVSQGVNVVLADSPWGSSYAASVDDTEFAAVKDLMATVVQKAHERGLKVVLYQTGLELIADPPRDPGSEHPDWPQVSLDGQPILFSDISSEQEHWLEEGQSDIWLSPCSSYRELSLARTREMAGTGIDGLWVDTVYLQHSIGEHEDLWPSTDTCSATAFQTATGLSVPTEEDWNDPAWRRWVVWRHDQMTDYLLAVKQAAREVNPNLVFFEENWSTDGSGATQYANDPAAYLGYADMSTGHEAGTIGDRVDEGETGMQDATLDQWLAFVTMIKWARGADDGKPSWVLTYGYQPSDAERLAGVILAEGANYYETRGPSMDDSVGADYRQRIFSWTAAYEAALYGGESAATVALAYSPRTRDLLDQGAGELYAPEEAPFFREYRQAAATLLRNHIPFDIVILNEDLSSADLAGYGTLILPNIVAMSDAEAAAVRDFADGGGKVIRIGETGSTDEWLEPRAADPLAGVPSIFIETVTTEDGTEVLRVAADAGQVDTDLTPWVHVGLRQTPDGLQLVLVNLGQDAVEDAQISVRLPEEAQVENVSASSPDDGVVAVEYAVEGAYVRLTLPDLPVLTLVEVRLG